MARKPPKKLEREYLDKIKGLGCVACYVQAGVWETPGEIHHLRDGSGIGQSSSWFDTICLCPGHHRGGEVGKFGFHSDRGSFNECYGTERQLLSLTNRNI